jgi:hypothetical protein
MGSKADKSFGVWALLESRESRLCNTTRLKHRISRPTSVVVACGHVQIRSGVMTGQLSLPVRLGEAQVVTGQLSLPVRLGEAQV